MRPRSVGSDPTRDMTSIKWIVSIACLVTAQAAPDDPGPQIFHDNSQSPFLNNQRGYVMKEVTLYLTPSQIKALEASKSDKGSPPTDNQRFSEHDLQKLEAEIKRQLERQHIYINDQSDIQRPDTSFHNAPQVQEHVNESPLDYLSDYQQKWTPIPKTEDDQKYFAPSQDINHHNPITKFPESYSFVKIYTNEKVHETPKLQLFHPIPHQYHNNDDLSNLFEVRRDPLHGKQYKLIPYEYLPDHSPGAPKPEEVKEIGKWVAELDQHDSPHGVNTFPQVTEDHKLDYQRDDPYLKYAPNFDEQKHTADYQNFVIKLEKENALSRTEAILKPPAIARKDLITKRRLISGNRHPSNPYLSPEKAPVVRHVWKH